MMLIALAIISALGWFGYGHYRQQLQERAVQQQPAPAATELPRTGASPFTCDGRKHCAEMRSCAEAKYFLKHCPGPAMDGDQDGVPCEQQWCTGG